MKEYLITAAIVIAALVIYHMFVAKALKLSYEESYDSYNFETL